MHVNRRYNSWRQKCDQEISLEDSKIRRPHNRNEAHVACESKSDTSYNRGDWNHFKITQKIPEQTYWEGTKIKELKKQPYCALHTHCGEC